MSFPFRILSFLLGLVVLVLVWPWISTFLVSNGFPIDIILRDIGHVLLVIYKVFMKGLGLAEARLLG